MVLVVLIRVPNSENRRCCSRVVTLLVSAVPKIALQVIGQFSSLGLGPHCKHMGTDLVEADCAQPIQDT